MQDDWREPSAAELAEAQRYIEAGAGKRIEQGFYALLEAESPDHPWVRRWRQEQALINPGATQGHQEGNAMSHAEQEHTIEDRIVMGLILRGVESLLREGTILVGQRAMMITIQAPIRIPLPQGAPDISGADGAYIKQAGHETMQELATGIRDTLREMEALPPEAITFNSEAERQAKQEAAQANWERIKQEVMGGVAEAEQPQAEEGSQDGKDNH